MKAPHLLIIACLLGAAILPKDLQAQLIFTTNNGAITITGYTGNPTTLDIPSETNGFPITCIGSNAFFNCTSLTTVTIPGSVAVIAYKAFTQCTGLTNVMIGNGTLSIEDHAFYDCTALTTAVIPASVTNISSGAFRYCSAFTTLTLDPANQWYCLVDGVLFNINRTTLVLHPEALGASYIIPAGVKNIADYALASCYGMTNVVIPDGVETIEIGRA